jgi:lipoyl(octanoyl) transferase
MLNIIDFGKENYITIIKKKEDIFLQKKEGSLKDDVIFIGEHYPVYTCGKRTKKEHLYNIPESIPVFNIERGGSVTFHGEGQIVIYPVIDLRNYKLSVKDYVNILEEIIIKTCSDFKIKAFRKKGYPGVFTEEGKIGFVGVRVSSYITFHGASLNVSVDKKYFQYINPCGINTPIVNMNDYTKADINNVKNKIIYYLKLLFNLEG